MTLAAQILTDLSVVFLNPNDFAVTGVYEPFDKSADVPLTVVIEEEGQIVDSGNRVDEQLTALILIGRDPDSDRGGVANVKPGDVLVTDKVYDDDGKLIADSKKWGFTGDIIELNSAGGWYRFNSTTVRQVGTQTRLS